MAADFQVNVYQINQTVFPSGQSQRIGFPTGGVMIKDCSGSPTRSLSSGVNVYSVIQAQPSANSALASTDLYYVSESFATLAALIG